MFRISEGSFAPPNNTSITTAKIMISVLPRPMKASMTFIEPDSIIGSLEKNDS
jgi:hypothetical protein